MIQSLLETGYLFAERYRLEKFLGAGGFAVVWRAYDTLTNTTIALKIFTNLDDQSIQDLASEYRTVQDLSHPAIIRAEHFDRIGNNPYLVMKFADGGNLTGRIGELKPMDVMVIMRQITEALEYIHQRHLIHQDIKPANILVDHTGGNTQYVLSDFGISSKSRTRLSKSVKDAGKGEYLTFAYAPPEKFSPRREERLPNPKGDIFSLGITAYELLTGHLPFDDLDTGRELYYHPEINIDLSEIHDQRLRNIMSACIQANPSLRPDAATLKKMLEGALSNSRDAQDGHSGQKTAYRKSEDSYADSSSGKGAGATMEEIHGKFGDVFGSDFHRQGNSTGGDGTVKVKRVDVSRSNKGYVNNGNGGNGGNNGNGERYYNTRVDGNPEPQNKKENSKNILIGLSVLLIPIIVIIIFAALNRCSANRFETDSVDSVMWDDTTVVVEVVDTDAAPAEAVEDTIAYATKDSEYGYATDTAAAPAYYEYEEPAVPAAEAPASEYEEITLK